jgi:hypothetical protein
MKKITFILAPLLIMVGLQANSKKIDKETLTKMNIQHQEKSNMISGDTFRAYSKPGAPIDMEFNSTKVDVNETADVNITLSTTVQTGTLSVVVNIDDNLSLINDFDNNRTFQINPNKKDFNLNLQVSSANKGLFYIRLLTKIDRGYGLKLRSFAVPVYVGKTPTSLTKSISPQMKALSNGENISVSKAVETIKVIKE